MSQIVYEEKPASQLIYNKFPKLVKSIDSRQTDKYNPRGPKDGITPNTTVEFDILGSQLLDLETFHLEFSIEITGGDENKSENSDCRIANALDVVSRFEVFYNDVSCNTSDHTNYWNNAMLMYTANRSYFLGDGPIALGLCQQATGAPRGDAHDPTGGRRYIVPLSLVDPFFGSIHQFLPLMGNRLRIRFTLAPVEEVISLRKVNTNTYVINNLCIRGDTVIPKKEYRQEIENQMTSADGLRLAYLGYSTHQHNLAASDKNYIRQTYNLSNALSLHMMVDPKAYKASVRADNVHSLWCQSFPHKYNVNAGFSKLRVRSGTLWFTDINGIQSLPELYQSTEKCHNPISNLDGNGIIDWKIFSDNYTVNADPLAGNYGLCMMSVNLEKLVSDDNDPHVLNSGISSVANGSTNQFDIDYDTVAVQDAQSNLLVNIVHRKQLVFSNGSYMVVQ
jgi:hypothetical protein